MAQATPQVLFYFTFVPIWKSSIIKTVCQVLPLTSKIPGNHFREFHSLQMKGRVEECLGWGAEVVQLPGPHPTSLLCLETLSSSRVMESTSPHIQQFLALRPQWLVGNTFMRTHR